MGYNARHLARLKNEVVLISIAETEDNIQKKNIRLAFQRQALSSTYINNKKHFTHNYSILFYKPWRSYCT